MAAHIVDRVLPDVPIRQWVLSLPFEVRPLVAKRPEVLGAIGRIFADAILKLQTRRAGIASARGGAMTFVQRFGGSLNLNVHFHVLVLDGLFSRSDNEVRFHSALPPSKQELLALAEAVHRRALLWLKKHACLTDDRVDYELTDALDGCARLAAARGTIEQIGDIPPLARSENEIGEVRESRFSAEHYGFNIHAAVRVCAGDDVAREKLIRYCGRPTFALDRVSVLRDGRIAYRVKYGRRGAHRLMTPVEFLARIAALVPPPHIPLVRYHGVLAPRSLWRPLVVPRVTTALLTEKALRCAKIASSTATSQGTVPEGAHAQPTSGIDQPSVVSERAVHVLPAPPRPPEVGPSGNERLLSAFLEERGDDHPYVVITNALSDAHVQRLLGGVLRADSPRVEWAKLLRRTFDFDALECPSCGGKLRVLSEISEPEVVRKILDHLGFPSTALPVTSARDPTEPEQCSLWDDDLETGVQLPR